MHEILLQHDVVIIESLAGLSSLAGKRVQLFCVPAAVAGQRRQSGPGYRLSALRQLHFNRRWLIMTKLCPGG